MPVINRVLLSLMYLALGGCFTPIAVDAGIRVHGTILMDSTFSQGVAEPECTARLLRADSSEVVAQVPVWGEFTRTFVVGAAVERYKIDVVCGGNAVFRSDAFEFRPESNHYDHPIELGVIHPRSLAPTE